MTLIRRPHSLSLRDPFADMDPWFGDFFSPSRLAPQGQSGFITPHIDIEEDDESYSVKADLPGVKKDDIDVSLHDNVLTIEAKTEEKSEEKDKENNKILRQERRVGQYMRQFSLSGNVSADGTTADFTDGVLTLRIPKLSEEQVQPTRVQIN